MRVMIQNFHDVKSFCLSSFKLRKHVTLLSEWITENFTNPIGFGTTLGVGTWRLASLEKALAWRRCVEIGCFSSGHITASAGSPEITIIRTMLMHWCTASNLGFTSQSPQLFTPFHPAISGAKFSLMCLVWTHDDLRQHTVRVKLDDGDTVDYWSKEDAPMVDKVSASDHCG